MAGLKAMFKMGAIREFMESKVNDAEQKFIEALQYSGEEFVNKARVLRTYEDRTGNLRSSIGYVILKDGKVIDKDFQLSEKGTDRKTGLKQGKEFIQEIASQYPKGYVLIGVAGMDYAAAVESLKYDVITGSAPTSHELKDLFGAIKL